MKKIISWCLTRTGRGVLLVLAGMISGLAFAPYYVVWILPVTLSFLFFCINTATLKKQAFVRAFGFGFGLGAFSTSWIAHALMIDGGAFAALIPVVWLGMGLLFGLFFSVPAALSLFARAGLPRLFAWAALFTFFEWVRSWILTGFPWNLMGSVWENTLPVLQSAALWGVYGLSLLTVLMCSVFALWPQKKPIMISFLVFVVVFGVGAWRLYDATRTEVWGVRLRLVQPNIPQTLKWRPEEMEASFSKLLRLSRENNKAVTHVIWPESAVPFLVNWDEANRLRLMSAVRQGGTLLMGGLRAVNPSERTIANSFFVLDDLASVVSYYDKSHLVPFGEYVPLRGILPLDKIVPIDSDFSAGAGVRTIPVPKAPSVGPLVCYEVIFSGRVVDPDRRPEWLVNVTNDGWYGISAGPYQHLGMARMRAVEEGLPLVRVANTGISAVFNGYGEVIASLPLGTEGVIDSALPTALAPTPYARYGVWIPLGFCGFIFLFSVFKRK